MKEFDWETFCEEKSDIVVHCKTKEEAEDFCKQMHLHGLCWCSNTSYLSHTNYETYTTKTCYTGDGTFQSLDYFIKPINDRKILEWSDYMQVIPKDILKPGYMLKLRNGCHYICLPYTEGYAFIKPLVNPKNLKSYDNELNHKENNDLDVMKIYGLAKYDVDILSYSSTERLLLWERDEHPKIKMTVDEMKQKLEEILNAKIVEE